MNNEAVSVLLIEDDEEDYIIARRILTHSTEGRFSLTWAASLGEGLERLGPGIDVVLLDLSLPDSQGWETFERVHARAPGVAIILLTGLNDGDLGRRAVHEGAQDYVVKGEQEAQWLCRTILYGVERKRIKDRLEQVVEELRLRNEQMAADLNVAREVQLALMPRAYPVFPPAAPPEQNRIRFGHFYHPCRTVGGDFFSIIPVSDYAAGVFICDVMGHGMRSALVTAIIRGLLEELRSVAHDPGRLLTKANRAFSAVLRQPHEAIFASALYVLVDVENDALTGANAGHPPPLHLSADGATAAPIRFEGRAFGPALGIDDESCYETSRWSLAAGDRLLLFTDGLIELTDQKAEEYGTAHLLQAARAHAQESLEQLVRSVILDAVGFSAREEPEDDICLVGVQAGGVP